MCFFLQLVHRSRAFPSWFTEAGLFSSLPRDLGGCLTAANMATFNWPHPQILAYRLTGKDCAQLKKSQTH